MMHTFHDLVSDTMTAASSIIRRHVIPGEPSTVQ